MYACWRPYTQTQTQVIAGLLLLRNSRNLDARWSPHEYRLGNPQTQTRWPKKHQHEHADGQPRAFPAPCRRRPVVRSAVCGLIKSNINDTSCALGLGDLFFFSPITTGGRSEWVGQIQRTPVSVSFSLRGF